MSSWTHVYGVLIVETYGRTDAESLYLAGTVVDHLPRITGSEGAAEYYINLIKGYNHSSNVDDLNQRSNLGNDDFGLFSGQSEVIITLQGDLRDRWFPQTLRETTKMLSRLSSRLWVRRRLVNVMDDFGHQEFTFNTPAWIYDRDRSEWIQNMYQG